MWWKEITQLGCPTNYAWRSCWMKLKTCQQMYNLRVSNCRMWWQRLSGLKGRKEAAARGFFRFFCLKPVCSFFCLDQEAAMANKFSRFSWAGHGISLSISQTVVLQHVFFFFPLFSRALKLTRRPLQLPTAYNMQVQPVYRLLTMLAFVDDNAVSSFSYA